MRENHNGEWYITINKFFLYKNPCGGDTKYFDESKLACNSLCGVCMCVCVVV